MSEPLTELLTRLRALHSAARIFGGYVSGTPFREQRALEVELSKTDELLATFAGDTLKAPAETPVQSEAGRGASSGGWYWPLFRHMDQEFQMTLTSTQMDDLIVAVEQCQKRRAEESKL